MKKTVFGVLCGFAVLAGCGDDASKTIESVSGTCDTGLVKCTNDLLGTVECGLDGQWKTEVTPCAADTPVCDMTINRCVAVSDNNCLPNSTKCVDDSHYKVCNISGRWGSTYTCSNGLSKCSTVLNKCVAKDAPEPECVPNSTECANNRVRSCDSDGMWGSFVACSGDTPVCDDNGKRCVSNTPMMECEPAQTECRNNEIRICDSEGIWGDYVACPDTRPFCDADGKLCVSKTPVITCKPSETECRNNEIRICDSEGQWGEYVSCPNTRPFCDTDGKLCVSKTPVITCEPSETECRNNEIRTCSSEGIWGGYVSCPDNTPVCNDEGTACEYPRECESGEKKCADAHDAELMCTDNGKWNIDEPVLCHAGFECSDDLKRCACTPGEVLCTYIGSRSEGMYKCNDKGDIVISEDLIKHCTCNETLDGCIDKCDVEGARKCDGIDIYSCKKGMWNKEDHTCGDSQICNDAIGSVCISAVESICKPGESICLDGVLMECVDGMFNAVDKPMCGDAPCDPIYCITKSLEKGNRQAEYTDSCVNTYYCIDKSKYYCDSMGSVSEISCTLKGELCMLSDEPVVPGTHNIKAECKFSKCKENALACNGNVLSICSDHTMHKLVDCSLYGLVCDKEAGCVGR